MSHSSPALQQFVQSIPVCESTASLDAIQSIFETGQHDLIVIVSEDRAPLGTIALKMWMAYLSDRLRACTQLVRTQSDSPLAESSATPWLWGNDSRNELHLDLRAIATPIAILPINMSVRDFMTYWQAGQLGNLESQSWALVDESGQFQGLLDSWRLLNAFLPINADLDLPPPPLHQRPNWAALLQLLDKLPIPLMLQTPQGRIRHQNLTWREQIGDTSDFDGRKEVERWGMEAALGTWCDLSQDKERWGSPLNPPNEEAPPDDSVSVGSGTSKGKIWQFTKLPLDVSGNWEMELTRGERTKQTWQATLVPPDPRFEIAHLQSPLWLVIATDITEQRQLCKELAAKNADLIQLNRLKDEFLACISHELKTPLTAVLGLSSLLKDRKLGELNPRQARYAQMIHQSGRQLMTVVNDLLDLTRIEAGQLKLNVEPVPLGEICTRAYEQARSHIAGNSPADEAQSVKFTLDIEPDLEAIVADRLRLSQMLIHLLDNALKFTPPGGEIGLKVNRWEGWIEFTVWDTGIGIPEASQHLIFQKFQQLESPLTRQFEGTGLGLVLTQRLAHAHGGDISFISKAGQGSQFTLLLPPSPPGYGPRSEENRARGRQNPSSLLKSSNPLVLVVEATPIAIEQLNEQLQKLGYRVAIARSGTEALEKARQLKPRAILLNPVLPLLSGWDVLTLLKTDRRTQDIPAIVTATRAEKELALQNGANGFLTLPVEKLALQELLYRLGDRSQASDRALTILRLSPDGTYVDEDTATFSAEFDLALSACSGGLNYRILATDDLEQADILARVWRPDVLLLDGFNLEEPLAYLQSLENHDYLAHLPLVTLDARTTEAANQVKGLSVFPCLVQVNQQGVAALLQVIQIAAGMSSQPHVLIVGNFQCDPLAKIPQEQCGCPCYNDETQSLGKPEILQEREASSLPNEHQRKTGEIEFLHALVQYLHKAGLKSSLTCSWTEVYNQIQHQGVDLLLLYLGHNPPGLFNGERDRRDSLLPELQHLAQLPIKPPILVLDRLLLEEGDRSEEFNALLEEVATQILRGSSHSCSGLLQQIHNLIPGQN